MGEKVTAGPMNRARVTQVLSSSVATNMLPLGQTGYRNLGKLDNGV